MAGSVYFAQAFTGQSNPETIHWGEDSYNRADERNPVGGYSSLYDAVGSANGGGRKPESWGRYIGLLDGGGQLDQKDANFLHSRNCRVLLIYNNTYSFRDAQGNSINVSTYADEQFHASKAIDYITAQVLRIPSRVSGKRVWKYLNTETGDDPFTGRPFPILPSEFYEGWCDRLSDPSVPAV